MTRAMLIGLFLFGCGPSRDMREKHEALCKLECACTGCAVESCVDDAMRLRAEQAERNCAAEGDAITLCKLQSGGARCERASTLVMLMATDMCKPHITALFDCLGRNPNPNRPQPQPVRAP